MGTNLQTGNSNMDGKCQERQKHRDMGTERKVSSFSPGAQGRLLGEVLKDKSGVAEQRSRWESVGTCRGLLGVRHGWSKNPAGRT